MMKSLDSIALSHNNIAFSFIFLRTFATSVTAFFQQVLQLLSDCSTGDPCSHYAILAQQVLGNITENKP
ncbi:hypothetical protein KO533_00270 [Shewanella sp. NKUCC05_KAH]|uniref:hypothetical protein n=1 Tax=Shewanella sp. NKUCC05_KAH TaxID=2842126 RepID=UPI001C5B4EC9|nr:hypothetical protein [Shewanella sp. NKUCC05_KAH]MBW3525012.1 hypothetical protein [Shewanella sp. NKUCC05_KAH]